MPRERAKKTTLRVIEGGQQSAEAMGARCDVCPLKDEGKCVFGTGDVNAKVAIVGEAPGPDEVRRGLPFVGRSGEMLEKLLFQLGLRKAQVFITNALLHMPPEMDLEAWMKRAKKKAKEDGDDFVDPVDACRARLFYELRVPRCHRCGEYQLGARRCFCKRPVWIPHPSGLDAILVVIPVGNAAMRALLNFDGITSWRGSRIDVEHWRMTGETM